MKMKKTKKKKREAFELSIKNVQNNIHAEDELIWTNLKRLICQRFIATSPKKQEEQLEESSFQE